MKRFPIQTPTCSSCTFGTTNPSLCIPTCRHSHRRCLILNAMMVYPILERCPDCLCHLSFSAGNIPSLTETNSTDLTLRPKQLEACEETNSDTDTLRGLQCSQTLPRSPTSPPSSPQRSSSPPPSPSSGVSPSSSPLHLTTTTKITSASIHTKKSQERAQARARAQAITRQSQQIALVKQYMQVTGMTPPPGYYLIDVKGDVESITASENIEDGSTSGSGL